MLSLTLCLALIGIAYGAYECTESNTWGIIHFIILDIWHSTKLIYRLDTTNLIYNWYNYTVNLPNVPAQTGEVTAAIIGDNLYVAGESNTDTYKYDLKENKWSTVAKRIYAGNHQNSFVVHLV